MLRDAEQAFMGVLSKYGRSNGRAWIGLAESQSRLGKYDESAGSYGRALALQPGNRTLQRRLRNVRDQQLTARTAASILPTRETVLQALPCTSGAGPDLWVVLSASVKRYPEGLSPFGYTNSHLAVFQGRPSSLRLVWRSKALGYPGHTDGEFNDVYLFVRDVTGDGIPDFVVSEVFIGGDWLPSHIDIFSWVGGSPKHLLGAVSDHAPVMRDLDHDGRFEVMTSKSIGRQLCHADQPGWPDIYAYSEGTYRLANARFPAQYRGIYSGIRTAVRKSPDDSELLYYLGRIYDIQHRERAARSAYGRALSSVSIEIATARRENDRSSLPYLLNLHEAINARLGSARGRTL